MYFKYGSYQHDDNEVNLAQIAIESRRNPRGEVQTQLHRWAIEGELLTTSGQSGVKSKINDLIAAYSVDGRDAGLYHDNGAVSSHFLDSSRAMGGVKITSRQFPGGGDEYVNSRKYSITLEAEFVAFASNLIAHTETISIRGTGGPKEVLIPLANGPPQRQTVAQRTPVFITQSGSAVGFSSYPDVPPPVMPFAEMHDQRTITRVTPRVDRGLFIDYQVQWSYQFQLEQLVGVIPTPR